MRKTTLIFVGAFCLLIGFLNIIQVVLPALKTPPGRLYLAPGHYLPDYLGYLSLIGQGYRGFWSWENLLTSEPTSKAWVISWPYIIVGHFSRLFNLSTPAGYWLTVFLLTFGAAFLAYAFIRIAFKEKKSLVFPAFLTYLFSGPFIKIESFSPLKFGIYDLTWYYRTVYFDRTSGIIHHLLSNFLVIAFLTLSWRFFESLKEDNSFLKKKNWLSFFFLGLILIMIMSLTPIRLTYLLPALGLAILYAFWRLKIKSWQNKILVILSFGLLGVILLLFGLFFKKDVAGVYLPEAKAWEISAMDFPSFSNFILASGPVLILSVIALFYLIKKSFKVPPSIFLGVLVSFLSYLLFFTRFSLLFDNHNSRLLFPDSYLFSSVILFLGLDQFLSSKKVSSKKIIWAMTLLFITSGLPSIFRSLANRDLKVLNPGFDQINIYLPKEIIQGFGFIEDQPEDSKIVLSAQSSDIGNLVPLFAQAKVFAGREVATIDFAKKSQAAEAFFENNLPTKQKTEFLYQNKINYIIWSVYDSRRKGPQYFVNPLFLSAGLPVKLVFANSQILVFKVE